MQTGRPWPPGPGRPNMEGGEACLDSSQSWQPVGGSMGRTCPAEFSFPFTGIKEVYWPISVLLRCLWLQRDLYALKRELPEATELLQLIFFHLKGKIISQEHYHFNHVFFLFLMVLRDGGFHHVPMEKSLQMPWNAGANGASPEEIGLGLELASYLGQFSWIDNTFMPGSIRRH